MNLIKIEFLLILLSMNNYKNSNFVIYAKKNVLNKNKMKKLLNI